MIIGVTGKYGSGKDAVTRVLVSKGFTEINVDAIGHRVLEEKKDEVVSLFGTRIIDSRGAVSRRALGNIIFGDPEKRALLESLLHPRMKELVRERITHGWGHFALNAALLFPMGFADIVDCVICVRAPFFIRYLRAAKRDRIGFSGLFRRFTSQRKIIPKRTADPVDIYYVTNAQSIGRLERKVDHILQAIMRQQTKEGKK